MAHIVPVAASNTRFDFRAGRGIRRSVNLADAGDASVSNIADRANACLDHVKGHRTTTESGGGAEYCSAANRIESFSTIALPANAAGANKSSGSGSPLRAAHPVTRTGAGAGFENASASGSGCENSRVKAIGAAGSSRG